MKTTITTFGTGLIAIFFGLTIVWAIVISISVFGLMFYSLITNK